MLSKKIEDALNNQIAEESYASHYYLAMASWLETSGLPGSAKFLYLNSAQESDHLMKLFHYVNEAGGHALIRAVKEPPQKFKSILDVFGLVVEHEQYVTKTINTLADLCAQEKDYSTLNFLQWYVAEQHEEERKLKLILDLIKLTGIEGRGLFLVDKEIGKMVGEEQAKKSS
ncbi:MAG: ferritin [Candidatus Omnitrophota bacterium]